MNEFFNRKKILITGGCGFIGSNLAIKLVELKANVTIVDSMIPEYGGNLFNIQSIRDQIQLSFTDIRDRYAMRYLICGQDIIFNLAGQVSHIDSMENPFNDLEINAKCQLQLLELCRQYNPQVKIVFTSTRQIYGRPQYLPVDEKHTLNPVDINGINKLAGERYHQLYFDVYGIPTVIIRLTNTYGPRQLVKHTRQGFTGTFIRRAVQEQPIQLFGTGEQRRDFNFVDDVVAALLTGAFAPNTIGKIYNLGSTPSYSLKEFILLLKEECTFDYTIVPFPEDKKKIDIGDYYSDYSRFKNDTGWEPKTSLKEGLRQSVEYYHKHGEHYWD